MENVRILRDEFVNIGIFVLFILLIGGVILSFALWPLAGQIQFNAGFSLSTIWFLIGGAVVALGIYLLLKFVDRSCKQHDYELRPPGPQIVKVIEPAQPVAVTPPVLSSGVEIQPHMVGEWLDKDDLAWLCRYIALKKDWTARTLEGLPLPKSHLVITNKDSDETHPTTYARLMLLFTGSGLIVNRSDRKTGDLTETDPDKMLEKILKRF